MYNKIFILLLSIIICEVKSTTVGPSVVTYFNSDNLKNFRKEWDIHRKPIENAIALALKETVGLGEMNVYVKKVKENLAMGYYHDDNQVKMTMINLNLEEPPRFWMPEVQFSLTSNVLKIQSTVSKMIVHADYMLARNKSDIIYNTKDQNPYKVSPFLFQQVDDNGRVAITISGCLLIGLIITSLNGESVNLGYSQLRLINCQYTVEIYKPGFGTPPVIAKYVPYREENDLGLSRLLMKPISEELIPKLQAIMFSFVNTSSVFDDDLIKYRVYQEEIFQATSEFLTLVVRMTNKVTIQKNKGVGYLEDFTLHWDAGKIASKDKVSTGVELNLLDMVVTGLDTLYSAHIGGPYRLNTDMIGEEIRFSTLQVRGFLDIQTVWHSKYEFAVEITDLAVDLQLNINTDDGEANSKKKKLKSRPTNITMKKIAVTGYRTMVFMVPTKMSEDPESLITGYLMNEVPKLINLHLSEVIPEVLRELSPKDEPKDDKIVCRPAKDSDLSDNGISPDNDDSSDNGDVSKDDSKDSDKIEVQKDHVDGQNLKHVFKSHKNRFKSFSKHGTSRRKFSPKNKVQG